MANQILGTVTLDDIDDFIGSLEDYASGYCGQQSIDYDRL